MTILAALALTLLSGGSPRPGAPGQPERDRARAAVLTVLGLIYRVLISVPGPDSLVEAKAGAYLGPGLRAGADLRRRSARCARRTLRTPSATRAIPMVEPRAAGADPNGVPRRAILEWARDARPRTGAPRRPPGPPGARRRRGRADGRRAVQGARPRRADPRARPRGRAADLARGRRRPASLGPTSPSRACRETRAGRRLPSPSRAASASPAPASTVPPATVGDAS